MSWRDFGPIAQEQRRGMDGGPTRQRRAAAQAWPVAGARHAERRRGCGPRPAGLGHQLAARSVPQLLGFHQDAVRAKDWRVDHRHVLTGGGCRLRCYPWHSWVMARNPPRQPVETVVEIGGPTIRLGQLMKLAGLVDSGGDVRPVLGAGQVAVNGTREDRRGRQLRHGDVVDVAGTKIRVSAPSA
jgi:ribosome-associated protein